MGDEEKNYEKCHFEAHLAFCVPGHPAAKPAWARSRTSRKARDKAEPWFRRVRRAAEAAVEEICQERGNGGPWRPRPLYPPCVPLMLLATFHLPRPKGHWTRDGRLTAAGRRSPFPTSKPDLTNLVKGVEDVLADWPRGNTPLVYAGDQQIVEHVTQKRWARAGGYVGVSISVQAVVDGSHPCD